MKWPRRSFSSFPSMFLPGHGCHLWTLYLRFIRFAKINPSVNQFVSWPPDSTYSASTPEVGKQGGTLDARLSASTPDGLKPASRPKVNLVCSALVVFGSTFEIFSSTMVISCSDRSTCTTMVISSSTWSAVVVLSSAEGVFSPNCSAPVVFSAIGSAKVFFLSSVGIFSPDCLSMVVLCSAMRVFAPVKFMLASCSTSSTLTHPFLVSSSFHSPVGLIWGLRLHLLGGICHNSQSPALSPQKYISQHPSRFPPALSPPSPHLPPHQNTLILHFT